MQDTPPPPESEPAAPIDADVVDAVRAVARRVDGRLGIADYEAARDDDHPSGNAIASRYGWAAAVDAAGVASYGPRAGYDYDADDCVEAVAAAVQAAQGNISTDEYSAWARACDREDIPSVRTVQKRVGWANAKERAFELLETRRL